MSTLQEFDHVQLLALVALCLLGLWFFFGPSDKKSRKVRMLVPFFLLSLSANAQVTCKVDSARSNYVVNVSCLTDQLVTIYQGYTQYSQVYISGSSTYTLKLPFIEEGYKMIEQSKFGISNVTVITKINEDTCFSPFITNE